MKKIAITLLVLLSFGALNAQTDTTIAYYDFNSLTVGNLFGKDSWKTTLAGTSIDIQVQAAYSHDNSNAIHFTQNGGGINASGNRPLDTIFPNFNYADSGIYYIYFDIKREYWGSEFGLGYDQNNDGKINSSANSEKGLRFYSAQNGGTKMYLPNGTNHVSATLINSGWNRIEIKLEPHANAGHGYLTLRYQAIGGTTWTTIFNNVSAGLDTAATNAKNPSNWDNIFFHFTGSNSGIDNIELWRIAAIPPPPNQLPTDIALSADTIRENMASHTLIGAFTTTDLDSNDTHQYSFAVGAGDDNNSEFMIGGDILYSSISFNYEDTALKYIRIKSQDQNGGAFEKAFVINVLDVVEVSISEILEQAISIYPNPASDKIILELNSEIAPSLIRIYSINGVIAKEIKPKGDINEIDIRDIPDGYYIISIESKGNNTINRRIHILH